MPRFDECIGLLSPNEAPGEVTAPHTTHNNADVDPHFGTPDTCLFRVAYRVV